jgi:hypothetical protein
MRTPTLSTTLVSDRDEDSAHAAQTAVRHDAANHRQSRESLIVVLRWITVFRKDET